MSLTKRMLEASEQYDQDRDQDTDTSWKIPRDVLLVLEAERFYQNSLGPERTDGCPKSVGDYIAMLGYYKTQLDAAWTTNPGDIEALHVIRKIAGIAIRCMEEHGAFPRELNKES